MNSDSETVLSPTTELKLSQVHSPPNLAQPARPGTRAWSYRGRCDRPCSGHSGHVAGVLAVPCRRRVAVSQAPQRSVVALHGRVATQRLQPLAPSSHNTLLCIAIQSLATSSSQVTIHLLYCDPFPIQASLNLSRYKICIVTHFRCLSSLNLSRYN